MVDVAVVESKLRDRIRACGSAIVALSGGVDSAVVAAVAVQELGARALAVTGVSASLAQSEVDDAAQLCQRLGLRHQVVETDELDNPDYRRNDPDRCFHCKDTLYRALERVANIENAAAILDGTQLDDLAGHRPGYRAAREHAVQSPLVEVGADKATVRQLAQRLSLPCADKPAAPCLSSRVAYGVEVTPERLRRIEQAEAFLRGLGLHELRVRLHDAIARIEVPVDSMTTVVAHAPQIRQALRSMGFVYVTLDLGGLRSGSLLEVLQT